LICYPHYQGLSACRAVTFRVVIVELSHSG
jgi:hypothetical protein